VYPSRATDLAVSALEDVTRPEPASQPAESTSTGLEPVGSAAKQADSESWIDWKNALRVSMLELSRVEIRGTHRLDPLALERHLALPIGEPLIDVSPDKACEKLLQSYARLATCAASRRPPGSMRIEVQEREPIGALGDTGQAIDAAGVRFPVDVAETDLPRIEGKPERLIPYLAAARTEGIELARITTRRSGLGDAVELVPTGASVRVLAGDDPVESIRRYRAIADSGVLQREGARAVDLRFRGRVFLADFTPADRAAEGSQAEGATP